jgi:hypothetical protein
LCPGFGIQRGEWKERAPSPLDYSWFSKSGICSTVEVCQYKTGLFVQEDGMEKVTSPGKFPLETSSVLFPLTRIIEFNILKVRVFDSWIILDWRIWIVRKDFQT